MKDFTRVVLATLLLGCTTLSWAGPITYSFSQTGFSGGGSVSGLFRGTDLDGDGRIYAAGPLFVLQGGLDSGNELDYLEVTIEGFDVTPDPVTQVYDKSVADMTEFVNALMGFAYNIDGGPIGDEADEGISFAFFSPSLNYAMGSAFAIAWNPPIHDEVLNICGMGDICGSVFTAEPANNPSGYIAPDQYYTSESVTGVPLPGAGWLVLSGMGVMGTMTRRKQRRS